MYFKYVRVQIPLSAQKGNKKKMNLTLVRVKLRDGQELNYIIETSSYSLAVITCMNYLISVNPNVDISSIELPGSLLIPKINS